MTYSAQPHTTSLRENIWKLEIAQFHQFNFEWVSTFHTFLFLFATQKIDGKATLNNSCRHLKRNTVQVHDLIVKAQKYFIQQFVVSCS